MNKWTCWLNLVVPVVVEVNVVAEVDDEEMGISVCMHVMVHVLLLEVE